MSKLDVLLVSSDAATAGVRNLGGFDAAGRSVLSPAKFIDLREHGLSTSETPAENAAAFGRALVDAQARKVTLFLPDGDYPTNKITIPRLPFGTQISVFSNPGRGGRLIKDTADGEGLFQMSTPTPDGYMARLRFSNITFHGFAGNSPFAFRGYDLARCLFDHCEFSGGLTGLDLQGGIGNSFVKCNLDGNAIGLYVKRYTGGYDGYPNLNTFDQCQLINNTRWGVDFDHGKMLRFDSCDIEGNGTSGDVNTGGVRVGANIGMADPSAEAPGVILDTCWIEGNAGNAAVQLASGNNYLDKNYFAANNNATYDTYASGGRYALDYNIYATNKTNNHFETAGVAAGNLIDNSIFAGGITIDPVKTYRIGSTGLDNFPRVRTNRLQDIVGGTGIQARSAANAILWNAFPSGTPDSWLELVAQAGGAAVRVGSSLANADLPLIPLGAGLVKIPNGAWNTTHITLGAYHLWVDATGRLRIKNAAPTSDTDGTVIGTQA